MSKLSDLFGCTEKELIVSNLDMDVADDMRWLDDQGVDRRDRAAVENALRRGERSTRLHPLVTDDQFLQAVMMEDPKRDAA
jgi:hypothetical protein